MRFQNVRWDHESGRTTAHSQGLVLAKSTTVPFLQPPDRHRASTVRQPKLAGNSAYSTDWELAWGSLWRELSLGGFAFLLVCYGPLLEQGAALPVKKIKSHRALSAEGERILSSQNAGEGVRLNRLENTTPGQQSTWRLGKTVLSQTVLMGALPIKPD